MVPPSTAGCHPLEEVSSALFDQQQEAEVDKTRGCRSRMDKIA